MTQKHEKPVTTTLSLDRTTFKALKHLAVERETTVRELIREAVRQLLKKEASS
jgi:predicted DNA-binding ribbon-helix-helix protein